MKKLIDLVKSRGFNPSSKILQLTHCDMDGVVAVINMMNYVTDADNPNKYRYYLKNYDKIDDFVVNTILKKNIEGGFEPDFVVITDISIKDKVAEYVSKKKKPTFIVLDHHPSALTLNDIADNFFVDPENKKCGAEVTLDFIKGLGYSDNDLDQLNKLATQYDLWTWTDPKNRKFEVAGRKRGKAEMLNRLFYRYGWGTEDMFINRWKDGWGKGFNQEEIEFLKKDYKEAEDQVTHVKETKHHIDNEIVLIVDCKIYVNDVAMAMKEDEDCGYKMCVFFNTYNNKISVRTSDDSNFNVGVALNYLSERYDWLTTGGGHESAGGANITSIDRLDDFLDKLIQEYYDDAMPF